MPIAKAAFNFYIYAEVCRCRGANLIRDLGSPHSQRWVFGIGFIKICTLANALNTPPGEYDREDRNFKELTEVLTSSEAW